MPSRVYISRIIAATDMDVLLILRFYGKNSSYVHGGLDSNGKHAEAVFGQSVSFITSACLPSNPGTCCFMLMFLWF